MRANVVLTLWRFEPAKANFHGPPCTRPVALAASSPSALRPPTAALAVVAVPYRLIMADGDRLPQNGRVVLVVLRDGRQLEGELHTMSRRYEVGDVAFDPWEIETIEDVT
jgi:hypothetical protein